MGSQVRVDRNRFPQIARALRPSVARAVASTTERIASETRRRASSRIASTVEREVDGLVGEVRSGDLSKAIHAGFAEYGTSRVGAQPSITPAAEGQRRPFSVAVRAAVEEAARGRRNHSR